MQPTTEKLERLPRWAQDHIRWQDRKISELTLDLKVIGGQHKKSPLRVRRSGGDEEYFLKESDRVQFSIEGGEVLLFLDIKGGLCCQTLGPAVAVLPRATNAFEIFLIP